MANTISRRDALCLGLAGLVAGSASERAAATDSPRVAEAHRPPRPFLTPAKDFGNVSRGNPLPYDLDRDALVKARLTPETWRLEVTTEAGAGVERPLRIGDGTALTYSGLLKLGERHGVRFLKALQCSNIALPLGQGLWEGVPLRNVLNLCGRLTNTRRIFYWGYHNDDPKQTVPIVVGPEPGIGRPARRVAAVRRLSAQRPADPARARRTGADDRPVGPRVQVDQVAAENRR